MDIRQSPQYAAYLKSLGWQVEKLGQWYIFIKKFPLIGSLIKIQRAPWPLSFAEIEKLAQKYRAFQIIIEPASPKTASRGETSLSHFPLPTSHPGLHPLKSPFIPTKTLIKDLKGTEQEIFASFSKNKRRDIRLAEKKGLLVKAGSPNDFAKLKKDYLLKKFILPFGTEREINRLCQAFGENARILVVYPSGALAKEGGLPIAGTLLLFHDKVAYYWQAAATPQGKRLLAPTLLVWEAIKLSKKLGCTAFDFEGVYDKRFPQNKSWLGFTNFKEGFRGEEVICPQPLVKNCLPL